MICQKKSETDNKANLHPLEQKNGVLLVSSAWQDIGEQKHYRLPGRMKKEELLLVPKKEHPMHFRLQHPKIADLSTVLQL